MSVLEALLQRAKALRPAVTGIVAPTDRLSLQGAFAAQDAGLIEPVLIGDTDVMSAAVRACGRSFRELSIEPARPGKEAHTAARLASSGRVEMLMKGALHSSEFLRPLLSNERLTNGKIASHIVVTEHPMRDSLLLLSDGAVNVTPSLDTKRQIVQNAIDVARALGFVRPFVAILAAVETVVSSMSATLDAAALAEMSSRGQIEGGVVDGPLALDDALSGDAARIKHLESPAAGSADILISPDVEAGNILYKAFDVLAKAKFGAVVAGCSIPIVLTSRADSIDARVYSCAVGRTLLQHQTSFATPVYG